MVFKKRLFTSLFTLALVAGVTACKPTGQSSLPESSVVETTYSVAIDDVVLEQGEQHTITYALSPVGTASVATYAINSATPEGCISISQNVITAVAPGTATVLATITNVPNSAKEFSLIKTFSVVVNEPPSVDGEFVKNGSFENALEHWVLTPANALSTFTTTVTDNKAHSGEQALNLWSKIGGEEGDSDPLDLTISQNLNVDKAGDYLFSLWFKGDIETVSLSVLSGAETLKTGDFAGTGNAALIAPEQNDYVHLGIEVSIAAPGTYKAEIRFVASWSNNWGYADDVSFKLGTSADLVRPEVGPIEEYNFVQNANVGIDLSGWTNAGTSSINRGTNNGTYINCYGADGGEFHFYQEIKNLPEREYNALVKIIGSGDYTAETTESYFYIADADGVIIKKTDFVIPAYSWETVTINNIQLSGTVRIGIKFVATTKVWAGVTGFHLYSEGYEAPIVLSSDTSLTNIKILETNVSDNSVLLSEEDRDTLIANKADLLSHVSGTVAEGAALSAAVFDELTNVVTLTVTAEDGTTKDYLIEVLSAEEPLVWTNIPLVNHSFEDDYDATGWTKDNLKETSNSASGAKYDGNRGLQGYGNVLVPDSPASITQAVEGLEEGTKIKLSVWIATYYNSNGAKDDKVTSIKLLAGAQAVEMDSVVADASAFKQYVHEFTIEAADIVDGKVSVGLQFTMVSGGWINIDLFELEALLPANGDVDPVEPEDPEESLLGNKTFLNGDFELGDKSGWTFANFKDSNFVTGNGKRNGSYGVMGYGNIETPGEPATISQEVEGFKVGDKVTISVWISTYYNSNGAKDDKVTSIKLLAGEQAIEMDSVVAASSGWLEYAYEFTLTAADLVDGIVVLGLEFTMVSGGWINIDDFSITHNA